MSNPGPIPENLERIEELLAQMDAAADPNLRVAAVELVSLLMDLHGSGIARMVQMVSQAGAAGSGVIDRFTQDDLVGQLLILYNLHPLDLETRVGQALEKVRPLLESHGGDVDLLGIEDGIVRLRLEGNCHGCPSSSLTMKHAIEEALSETAADIAGLKVEGVVEEPPPAGFVPLETIQSQ